jgi:hypothetical protein
MKNRIVKIFNIFLILAVIIGTLLPVSIISAAAVQSTNQTIPNAVTANPPALPMITSLVPNNGVPGTSLTGVLINGINLTGATAVTFSGTGVTASNLVVNVTGTQITAAVTINGSAEIGARNITVTTPTAMSAPLVGGFTVKTVTGWYENGLSVDTAAKGELVTAKIKITLDPGHYTLIVKRDISGWTDETVASFNFDSPGGTVTEALTFTPLYATDEGSTNGYYMQLSQSGVSIWTTPNSYPPRLTVINRYALTIQVNPPSAGTVALSPPGQSTTVSWNGTYDQGTIVMLQATANEGYNFLGWSSDASGSNAFAPLIMTADKTIVANFRGTEQYAITNAWLTNMVDTDYDGYSSEFTINWTTSVDTNTSKQVYAQTYFVEASGEGILGVSNNFIVTPGIQAQQSLSIKIANSSLFHGNCDLQIQLYDSISNIQIAVLTGAYPTLHNIKLEQASEDATLSVENLEVLGSAISGYGGLEVSFDLVNDTSYAISGYTPEIRVSQDALWDDGDQTNNWNPGSDPVKPRQYLPGEHLRISNVIAIPSYIHNGSTAYILACGTRYNPSDTNEHGPAGAYPVQVKDQILIIPAVKPQPGDILLKDGYNSNISWWLQTWEQGTIVRQGGAPDTDEALLNQLGGWMPGHAGLVVPASSVPDSFKQGVTDPDNKVWVLHSVSNFPWLFGNNGGPTFTWYTNPEDFGGQDHYMGARTVSGGLATLPSNQWMLDATSSYYAINAYQNLWQFEGLGYGPLSKGTVQQPNQYPSQYTCVGLAETAYEASGQDIVSPVDEQSWPIALSPYKQWLRSLPREDVTATPGSELEFNVYGYHQGQGLSPDNLNADLSGLPMTPGIPATFLGNTNSSGKSFKWNIPNNISGDYSVTFTGNLNGVTQTERVVIHVSAPSATFYPTNGTVGEGITVTGSSWVSSETISAVTLGGIAATNSLTISADGALSGNITVPAVSGGLKTIIITGSVSGARTFDNAFNVTPSPGAAAKLSFTNSAQTTTAGVASNMFTVRALDAFNNPVSVNTTTIVSLTSSSDTGRFDINSSGQFDGTVTAISIPTGGNSINFYYKDTAAGTLTLTAANINLTSATQQEIVNPAGKYKLIWGTQPETTVTAGTTWARFTVKITDQYGNQTSDTDAITIVPSSGTLGGTLSKAAMAGLAIFNDVSRTLAGAMTITATSGTLTAAPVSNTITINVAAASQVRVESAANGSGTTVAAQNLTIGSSLTVYAVTRDQFGNHVDNPGAATWSLASKTGGIANSDLSATTGASAVITGHQTGSGVIHVAITGLTSADSGLITVVAAQVSFGGGGGGGSSIIDLNIRGFASSEPLKTTSEGIVQEAAKVKSGDGLFTLDIAKGTKVLSKILTAVVNLSVEPPISPPKAPFMNAFVGAYNFGPEGTTFDPPLTFTFSYSLLPTYMDENTLSVVCYNGTSWDTVPGKLDKTTKTIEAQISHFSTYAVIGRVSEPASPTPTAAATPTPTPTPKPAPTPTPMPSPTVSATPTLPVTSPLVEVTPTPTQTASPAPTTTPPTKPTPTWMIIMFVVVGIAAILVVVLIILRVRKTKT